MSSSILQQQRVGKVSSWDVYAGHKTFDEAVFMAFRHWRINLLQSWSFHAYIYLRRLLRQRCECLVELPRVDHVWCRLLLGRFLPRKLQVFVLLGSIQVLQIYATRYCQYRYFPSSQLLSLSKNARNRQKKRLKTALWCGHHRLMRRALMLGQCHATMHMGSYFGPVTPQH